MIDIKQLEVAELEIGRPVEQLLTPLTGYKNARPAARYAIDNGAFSKFDAGAFLSRLDREQPRRELCRFVTVPDVVGSARRTLECFEAWAPRLEDWPLALVCQDGQEHLPVPWAEIKAVFIGGSTVWKLSPHAEHVIRAAKILGKWVHIGRVNTPSRLGHFEALGADSFDGSGLARYTWMRESIRDTTAPTAPLFETATP